MIFFGLTGKGRGQMHSIKGYCTAIVATFVSVNLPELCQIESFRRADMHAMILLPNLTVICIHDNPELYLSLLIRPGCSLVPTTLFPGYFITVARVCLKV